MKTILLLFLLCACSSHLKTARELTDKSLYEEALPHWIAAFKDDPKDSEIKEGLKDCQEKIFNERLVKIRNLRMAKNHDTAVTELKNLLKTQAEWGLNPDVNSSVFQGNEVKYLWITEKEVLKDAAVKENKPLKAEYRLKHFEDVFNAMGDRKDIEALIHKVGLKECMSLNHDLSDKPYYRLFVRNHCQLFGKKITFKKPLVKKEDVLYSSMNFKGLDLKAEGDMEIIVENKMKKTFESSPWFLTGGKKQGAIQVVGSYGCRKEAHPINQVHSYDVEIPYTAYVSVSKSRQVPYTDSLNQTRYRSENYTEQEPRTKYRTETRTYDYIATKKTQECSLNLKGATLLEGKNVSYQFLKEGSESVIMHDYSMPEINLAPQTRDLKTPGENFEGMVDLASEELGKNLKEFWIQKYCSQANAENVIRCGHVPDYPATFVNNWFSKEFGVTYPEAQAIMENF
jgi:arsenate reductase-like glutaredoxin family protein